MSDRMKGWVVEAELYSLHGTRDHVGKVSARRPMARVLTYRPTMVKVGRKMVEELLSIDPHGTVIDQESWDLLREVYREAGAEIRETTRPEIAHR